ncbi:DUF6383 domain-containing protein [Parabacteroides sp.]
MNKKISTLLAAFLAAGYSYTVEAGVVRVTTVETGKTYVISTTELDADGGNKNILTSGDGVISFENGNLGSTFGATKQWEVSGEVLTAVALKQGDNGLKYVQAVGPASLQFRSGTPASFAFGVEPTATLEIAEGSSGNKDKFSIKGAENSFLNSETAGTFAGDEAFYYFYAISTPIANSSTPTYITIDGKYLVVVPAVTKAAGAEYGVKAMTPAEASLYPEKNAQWTIAGGVLTSVVSNTKLVVAENGSYSLDGAEGTVVEELDGKLVINNKSIESPISSGSEVTAPTFTPNTSSEPMTGFALFPKFVLNSRLHIYGISSGEGKLVYQANAGSELVMDKEIASDASDAGYYWTLNGNGTITNAAGATLTTKEGATKFTVVYSADGYFTLLAGGVQVYLDATNKLLTTDPTSNSAVTLGSFAPNSNALTAEQLNNHLGDAFGLKFYDSSDKNTSSIEGNVFTGKLTPMKWDNTNKVLVDAEDASDASGWYYLKRGDGKYIVMDMDGDNSWTSAKVEGNTTYSFKAIKESALIEYLKGNDKSAYKAEFQISYADPNAYSATKMVPVYSIGVRESATNGTVSYLAIVPYGPQYHGDYSYYLTAFQNNLTDDALLKYKAYVEFAMDKVVLGTDKTNNPLLHKYVNIAFANHSSVIYNTQEGRNTYATLNDKVLGVIGNGSDILPIDDNKVNFEKPEGQWAVVMSDMINGNGSFKEKVKIADVDESKFTFVNRESGAKYNVARMYHISGNTYAVEYDGANSAFALDNDKAQLTRDTLVIVKAETLKNDTIQQEGYFKETSTSLLDEQYRLAVASTDDVDFWGTENHYGKHFLGLSDTEANAANWRLIPMTVAREWDEDGDLVNVTDSVYIMNHPTVVDGDKFVSHNDTLGIISYVLQNTANGEYLTYESPKTTSIQQMICDPNSEKLTTDDLTAAYRFILKEKGNNKYNLIGVADMEEGDEYYQIELDNKLFGATTDKEGSVQVDYAYNRVNANDLFKVVKVDAPEYRKVAQGDTIRIFREENDYDTMYENGEFLNLGNKAQLTDMAPALYVDTAYVNRGHNNRYQYLLVVNPTRVNALPCDIEGHPAIHPDTTYGRFLVNLVDTAVYAYKNGAIHTNKYINDKEAGEPFVKLGFVWGFRTGDKLYVTKDNTFKKDSKRVIDLSTRDFNVAKFAFRYANPTDASDKSFKIQTRYVDYTSAISVKDQKDRAESNEGYLKTINGVVVVTDSYANGEVFNLAAEASDPTANDAINATSFSVKTIDGAVVIAGAEGKKVVISNLLGQPVASAVISSSEATISVPAGVVVVAVEGEAAVKAIVK